MKQYVEDVTMDPFDPGPPDTEHQRSFRTHAAYLRSFRELAVGPSYLDFRSYEATRWGLTCWFGFCSGVA